MYTLRIFKDQKESQVENIYLGDSYVTQVASKEDQKLNIKCRVFGNWDSKTKEGIAVHNDEYVYIMTQLGGTFETINRPKNK